MDSKFNFIYDRLMDLGNDLKSDEIDQKFIKKANTYKNYHEQMIDLLNHPEIDASNYQEQLKDIEMNNIMIGNRIRVAKQKMDKNK
jgi:hypothetical protein